MKHKSFNRTLAAAAILSLMFLIGLLPTTVFAAGTATVKINGQEMQDGVAVQCGEGTAVYDKQNNTLILNKATIKQEASVPVIRVDNGDLKIILIDENTITSTTQMPFYAGSANITIQGTKADSLIVTTDSEGLQVDNGNLTVDGCNVDITSTKWGGMLCFGTLTIKNGANITIDSHYISITGDDEIIIADSTVKVTSKGFYSDNGDGSNVINSMSGGISIDNSTVIATATSGQAFPTIYAVGDINVTNKSNVVATSSGTRGIFTDGNMTVTDSTVTATGTTREGMVVVGTLDLTNSKLTASSKPNDYIPAIVTKNFNITNSEVTANGGLDLYDWYNGTDDISLSITPANGKLAEFKVDGENWDGSAAEHFREGSESPYDTAINLSADEMNWLGAYRYIYIGEHIHTGGTATCEMPAICEDCGRPYGNALGHTAVKTEAKAANCTEDGNIEYWYCSTCGKYFRDEALLEEIAKEKTVVKATGHGEIEIKNAKEATCTMEGYTGDKVCKDCGTVLEESKVIPKLAHNYQDGKCTICGAADPNYSESPQTGDTSRILPWAVLMFVSGSALGIMTLKKRKKLS